MPEALRLALAIAGKDIRAELRSRTALLSAVVFAALVLVVFNFARDPTALSATDLAPSVLWVTFALAAMVALNRAFTIEREHGERRRYRHVERVSVRRGLGSGLSTDGTTGAGPVDDQHLLLPSL